MHVFVFVVLLFSVYPLFYSIRSLITTFLFRVFYAAFYSQKLVLRLLCIMKKIVCRFVQQLLVLLESFVDLHKNSQEYKAYEVCLKEKEDDFWNLASVRTYIRFSIFLPFSICYVGTHLSNNILWVCFWHTYKSRMCFGMLDDFLLPKKMDQLYLRLPSLLWAKKNVYKWNELFTECRHAVKSLARPQVIKTLKQWWKWLWRFVETLLVGSCPCCAWQRYLFRNC